MQTQPSYHKPEESVPEEPTLAESALKRYTPEEYLRLEETAEFRSEYRDGEITPMTGGSINHNRIVGSIYAYLKFALRGKNLEAFTSDLRLWIPTYQLYTYPDVMVIQGEPVFQAKRTDTVMNPCLIVEVLSKSTQTYDRTRKFKFYRSIAALQEYVLVDQYAIEIEHYTRLEDNSWRLRDYGADTQSLTLSSVELEIAIADLYEGVNFDLQDPEAAPSEAQAEEQAAT
ncbi:MAG: Uma2 family endonuclease [Drouetiella hepatica Uher 2000/2452]|jgi:Uma2 family endonuclease|uniref:Uma2 family endonuclease n=1 Tax=Drouetiella hepatica Uher 2000/2452 TaxID=904376 RepID=A0A951Q8F9_9CYAN|nr:Uma2 family endonuclease [Drouetiella hepatica Uher 2000/2452]